jgi:hypothetical protein
MVYGSLRVLSTHMLRGACESKRISHAMLISVDLRQSTRFTFINYVSQQAPSFSSISHHHWRAWSPPTRSDLPREAWYRSPPHRYRSPSPCPLKSSYRKWWIAPAGAAPKGPRSPPWKGYGSYDDDDVGVVSRKTLRLDERNKGVGHTHPVRLPMTMVRWLGRRSCNPC